ncbi:MFS transporter [Ectobacillus polymachus]|uniref:MFS transporter n=1 Tax=Ectobacillus polymachus TaxID=1508806 RepID=UPI003A8446DC
MKNEKLWSKDFMIVSSINFIVTLIFYLLMVSISIYAVDKFHASTSEAGLVTGIFVIGALFGRLLTGRIIEAKGRKKILFVGLICFIITTLFYFGATNLPLLLMNRFLHGIAYGITSTATGTIVARIIPPSRRGEGIGYYSLSAIIGTAIGPFLGLYFMQHTSFSMIFVFCLLVEAFGLVTAIFLSAQPIQENVEVDTKGFKISNYIEYKAIPIAFVTLIISFVYSSVLSFITFYAKELQLIDAASFFFVIYAIVVLLSRPFSGRLFDSKGANLVIYPTLLVFAGGMLLLSQVHQGWTLLLAGAIIGLGYGNYTSSAQTVSVKVTPPHRLGLATSTFFIFMDLGFGIGPYLIGFLIPYTGYRGLYLTMVGIILLCMVLYYFMHGIKEKQLNRGKAVLSEANTNIG